MGEVEPAASCDGLSALLLEAVVTVFVAFCGGGLLLLEAVVTVFAASWGGGLLLLEAVVTVFVAFWGGGLLLLEAVVTVCCSSNRFDECGAIARCFSNASYILVMVGLPRFSVSVERFAWLADVFALADADPFVWVDGVWPLINRCRG